MRVVFRADASRVIGHGHLARCLCLAQELASRGAGVLVLTKEVDMGLGLSLAYPHIEIREIPRGQAFDELPVRPPDSAQSIDWESDASVSVRAIRDRWGRAEVMVVDSYGLDWRWQKAVRTVVSCVMAIDDLANRKHDCDVLLDQNLTPNMDTRYDGKLPRHAVALLGPQYALLQRIYADEHPSVRPRTGHVKRILVSFGGADHGNLTGRVLRALQKLPAYNVAVDVVVVSGHKHIQDVRKLTLSDRRFLLHEQPEHLAKLMIGADLAVGACGTTTWERLCLGVPSVVITLAPNQEEVAGELSRAGLIYWLGRQEDVTESDLMSALDGLLATAIDTDWSRRCWSMVDGGGTERVASTLEGVVGSRPRP